MTWGYPGKALLYICQDKISHEIIHGTETHQAGEEMSSFFGNEKYFILAYGNDGRSLNFDLLRTISRKG